MSPSLPLRRRRLLAAAAVAAAALLVVALLVFEPWKLVVDRPVADPAPTALPSTPSPTVIARGELVAHEHASTGSVVVVRLPDGSRVLRLADLRTSDGPNLHVWLAAAPVVPGRDGWYVFDDGPHVDLGALRGNIGSSNYTLPPEVDLAALPSVTIWCERFSVSFAAATLHR